MNSQSVVSQSKDNSEQLYNIIKIVGASLFIALCAQIKIPLWFTPIPLTLQTFAVMILGATLGARTGAMATVLYLTQISLGLPFSAGGAANSLALIGPTAGYLYGMIAQAYLVGWLFERRDSISSIKLLVSVFAVSLIQLGFGTAWLATFVGWNNAPMMGFIPFIPGDVLKVFAATMICSKIRK
jgi:biotin transport system substrate-specific component